MFVAFISVPLIRPSDINFGLRSIKNKDKYCFPIVEFSPPIKQALKFDDANNTLKVLYQEVS